MKENIYAGLSIGLMIIAGIWLILVWFDVINFPFAGWIPWILLAIGGGIFSLYNNMESQKVSLFQLLVLVACADGEASTKEMQIIMEYAKRFDISGDRFNAIVKQAGEGKVQFAIPDEMAEREKNIRALVKMANADGSIDNNELQIIKKVASKYGISESFVDKLV